jgi:hypothetical protein
MNVPLPSSIDLHSGDQFTVTLTYDGTTLSETILDNKTAATFSTSYTVNIESIVGGKQAFVGFTGATGGETAVQDILTWEGHFDNGNGAALPRGTSGGGNEQGLLLSGSQALVTRLGANTTSANQRTVDQLFSSNTGGTGAALTGGSKGMHRSIATGIDPLSGQLVDELASSLDHPLA